MKIFIQESIDYIYLCDGGTCKYGFYSFELLRTEKVKFKSRKVEIVEKCAIEYVDGTFVGEKKPKKKRSLSLLLLYLKGFLQHLLSYLLFAVVIHAGNVAARPLPLPLPALAVDEF